MVSFLALTASGASALVADRSAVTPVEKVVQLLKRLGEQIQVEGKEEAASYDKFACFCRDQSMHKVYNLEKSGVVVSELQAAVDNLGAEITQLDSDVATLKTEVEKEEGAATTAAESRKAAYEAFVAKHQPLEEGIEAIKEAVVYLEQSRDGVRGSPKVAALLKRVQTLATRASTETSAAVSSKALVTNRALSDVLSKMAKAREAAWGIHTDSSASDGEEESLLQQKPNAYEYQSNDVIQTLQELLKTFKTELTETEEQEAMDRHSDNMVAGARSNRIKALKSSIDKKEELNAQKGEEKSEKSRFLQEEITAKTADQAFLDELTKTCEDKAQAWDQRSTTRASELTTITEAMGTLQGMGDTYSVNKKLVGLVAKKRREAPVKPHQTVALAKAAPALVQLSSAMGRTGTFASLVNTLAHTLEVKARSLNSGTLAEAVDTLRAEPVDHFVKVRGIIKDLISKLEADATDEATQKSFCDTETTKSITKRDEKKSELEGKQADIEKSKSEILLLEKTISELAESIASLHKALMDMTALRTDEKASNEKTIADASAGAEAVKQAITILGKFYGSDGAVQLLQFVPANSDRDGKTVSDLAPETNFSGEYDGKKTESKGILGLLEIIASDFERTSSTTEADETAAAEAFETQKTSTEADITQKETLKGEQESTKLNEEDSLVTLKDEAKDAQTLHEAALDELEKLKSSCVSSSESYEERAKKRQEEIAALKEAMNLLEEWKN